MLTIGNYCSFARGVKVLLGGEHRLDWVTTYPFPVIDRRFAGFSGHPASKGNVTIGNDVWIGRDALILSGVTIGDGAVIGAGAVVARNVSPFTVAAGNPAAEIRPRFAADLAERLRSTAWWDWPEDRIARAMPMLLSDDISGFLDAVESGAV